MAEKYPFPDLKSPVMIAMKGLHCTAKSGIGMRIGKWARSPVLYIDHFLDALSLDRGYSPESPPSPDEADRLHRHAFDALCKAASHSLRWGVDDTRWSYSCVVIKSRLSSTFELDRLVQLARERGCGMILIVELRMKNEFRFRLRLEDNVKSGGQKEWYKPRSWKDIEKAMEEDQPNDWDVHLRRLLDNGDGLPRVARLVFDPFDDLSLGPPALLTLSSVRVIEYLLLSNEVGQSSNKEDLLLFEGRYAVVQYRELLRSLSERELRDASSFSGEQRKYMDGGCTFKYWEELPDDKGVSYNCGVCDERVMSGHPAYSCIDCFLLLHKSCAELPDGVITFEGFEDIEFLRYYPNNGVPRHACKSCIEEGKGFVPECSYCLFQTHLKCRVLPTILKHDCHDHFLNLSFRLSYLHISHICQACGAVHATGGAYRCCTCTIDYDIDCLSQPREVEHEHGGHKHVLKLKYSHGEMEEEEGYWCDICFEDMDPKNWFYSCQNCPYYAAHPQCVRLSRGRRITASF